MWHLAEAEGQSEWKIDEKLKIIQIQYLNRNFPFFFYVISIFIFIHFFSLRAAMPRNQDGRKKSNSVFADEFIDGIRQRVGDLNK